MKTKLLFSIMVCFFFAFQNDMQAKADQVSPAQQARTNPKTPPTAAPIKSTTSAPPIQGAKVPAPLQSNKPTVPSQGANAPIGTPIPTPIQGTKIPVGVPIAGSKDKSAAGKEPAKGEGTAAATATGQINSTKAGAQARADRQAAIGGHLDKIRGDKENAANLDKKVTTPAPGQNKIGGQTPKQPKPAPPAFPTKTSSKKNGNIPIPGQKKITTPPGQKKIGGQTPRQPKPASPAFPAKPNPKSTPKKSVGAPPAPNKSAAPAPYKPIAAPKQKVPGANLKNSPATIKRMSTAQNKAAATKKAAAAKKKTTARRRGRN